MKHEDVFNGVLGAALERASPAWRGSVFVEETGMLEESAGLQPDILIAAKSAPPVAVETSYLKGDADKDAAGRLAKHYKPTMEEIKTAVAVELGPECRKIKRLSGQALRYAVHQALPDGTTRRFPRSGFMGGTYKDLARVASVSVPKEDVEKVAAKVADLVNAAAGRLEKEIPERHLVKISKTLYQRSAVTGLRTTAILWLDALLVQRMLFGGVHDVPPVSHVPSECVRAWKKIRRINWRAIFEPAIQILDDIRMMVPGTASESLGLLVDAVEIIDSAKLGSEINIGAELFQRIIKDRKTSATFYTQPATAEFLAALTVTEGMDSWDSGVFERLKVADITCGTGTLLRFGYRQIRTYHEQSGGTARSLEKLHGSAMEGGLYGADVYPIAAHLTSSSLAVVSKQPYGKTNVGWVGVGNMNRTGSIEYIKANAISDLFSQGFGTSSGTGAAEGSVVIRHGSINIILMNPPYSRTRRGQSAFDIAGLTDKERAACQARWGELIKDEPCIKTAGMAATFLCIANRKIAPGGRIGFVLPRTTAFAPVWDRTRDMIETEFEDITAVAVSAGALGRDAMSADTMMEEMLLTATKKCKPGRDRSPVRCVTLYEPMTRVGEAAEIARAVSGGSDDGPIMLGDVEIGISFMFQTDGGAPWSAVGAVGDTLGMIKAGLLAGRFENADGTEAGRVAMTTIGKLFKVGPTHDLIGHLAGGDPRGAFTFYPVTSETDAIGMYRSLWKADAKSQTSMAVRATHKGTVHREGEAARMWDMRSGLFYARNVRWTSQSLVAAVTEEAAMGGSTWTALRHEDGRVLKAFALWANSIYGMVTYWANGSRTHQGRSRLQVRAISRVQCPDFSLLEKRRLDRAARRFDTLAKKALKPAHLAVGDPTRAEISTAASEMLGIPAYDAATLTGLWCAEPSVKKPGRR